VGNPNFRLGTLDSDQSLFITDDGKYLYAVNSGSDTVAGFAIRPNGALVAVPGAAIALPQALGPGDWMQICVSDTGIGIPRAEVSRVFERFYKVDRARTRNAGGTGLGLAIAKHLVEGHGGCIWAISEEGAGSTFSLMLPLA
ncbi:MAG TPA: ATP-binding protein, partial [Kouleothrix sp.]|nr:ATP-binding protein [Kouleothrix sp.]